MTIGDHLLKISEERKTLKTANSELGHLLIRIGQHDLNPAMQIDQDLFAEILRWPKLCRDLADKYGLTIIMRTKHEAKS